MLALQKAFDTVDHQILLSKLEDLGADCKTVSWFSSYLNGRKQIVNVNGSNSMEADNNLWCSTGLPVGPPPFLFT